MVFLTAWAMIQQSDDFDGSISRLDLTTRRKETAPHTNFPIDPIFLTFSGSLREFIFWRNVGET